MSAAHITGLLASAGVLYFAAGPGASLLLLASYVLWRVAYKRRRRPSLRARKRRVWTDEERRFILDRDGWRCVNCGADDQLEIDHVIPFSRGGACSVENACVLCRSCNARKGAS